MRARAMTSPSAPLPSAASTPLSDALVVATAMLVLGGGRQTRLPGLAGFLDHLSGEGMAGIVVSACTRGETARILDEAGASGRLPACVCREDTAETLPDPAPLLLAAARLAMPAGHCLAIADSPDGVAAARAAGCPVIGLEGGMGGDALRAAGALTSIGRLDALIPLSSWVARRQAFGRPSA